MIGILIDMGCFLSLSLYKTLGSCALGKKAGSLSERKIIIFASQGLYSWFNNLPLSLPACLPPPFLPSDGPDLRYDDQPPSFREQPRWYGYGRVPRPSKTQTQNKRTTRQAEGEGAARAPNPGPKRPAGRSNVWICRRLAMFGCIAVMFGYIVD